MLVVNVTRTWLATNSSSEKIETVERAWPTRNAAEIAKMHSQSGDLLVAVARSKIVAIRKSGSVQDDTDEPSRFVFNTQGSGTTSFRRKMSSVEFSSLWRCSARDDSWAPIAGAS